MKRVAALLLLAFTLACEREPERKPQPAPAPAAAPAVDHERGNLLLIARGTTVQWRNAEINLIASAVHTLDGDAGTVWQSPFGGSMLLSLPARSRIRRVGVSGQPSGSAQTVRFAVSDDGNTWRDVATFAMKPGGGPQMLDVSPFETRELRVDVEEAQKGLTILPALFAYGEELEPASGTSALQGCWSINGQPARFVQRGSSIAGTIGDPRTLVSGGTDGRAFRVMWHKGEAWGFALLAADPQRRAMSGVVWHEDVTTINGIANAWFGKPAPCRNEPLDETAIAAAMLQRAGHWMMYGDSAIDTAVALLQREPSRGFRIVARDAARMNAVRAVLQSRGVDLARIAFEVVPAKPETESQRALADGVALYPR